MGRRKTFRKKIREQDELSSTTEQLLLFIKENPSRSAAYAGAVVLILLAVWGGSRFMGYRRSQILRREGESLTLYQAAKDDKTKIPETVRKLEAAYEESPGTLGGQMSLFQAANLLYAGGEYLQAADRYRRLVDKHADSTLIYPLALRNLAYTQEQTGSLQAARDTLEKLLASNTSGLPRTQTLLDLGRIYEGLGNGDKAAASWQEIVNSSPDSSYARTAREKLGLPPAKEKEK